MYPAADSLTCMPHYAAQYPFTFRVASTEAVSYDLSRGLPTAIFNYVRFIFVQHVLVLFCNVYLM